MSIKPNIDVPPEVAKQLPLHLRKAEDLSEAWVSSLSRWDDQQWWLDHDVPGMGPKHANIVWRIQLHDGIKLGTSPTHVVLVDWLKRFVWSLFNAPGEGKRPLAPASAGILSVGLTAFVGWMVFRGLTLPCELDKDVLDEYLEELPDLILRRLYASESGDDDEEEERSYVSEETISFSQAWTRLRIPLLIWQQRESLSAAGYLPMPDHPWKGRSPRKLARKIATRVDQAIAPVPDEVAIPVMNRAAWFLGVPSDDILRLREIADIAYSCGSSRRGKQSAQKNAVQSFKFSTEEGQSKPWREPIEGAIVRPGALPNNVMNEVRRLVMDVRDASMIVIESTTGMRSSEMLGLEAGINPRSGLPKCITTERSPTGIHEIFLVKSWVKKGLAARAPADWVLGMRPVGSTEVPIAVRALILVEKLFRPERTARRIRNRMFVSFKTTWGIPRNETSIRDITNGRFNNGMRDFVERYVDLSHLASTSAQCICDGDLVRYKLSKGRCIRSAQWRKTLGNFVYRTDPRLIPALSMHFKHMSIVMTEQSYIGRNTALLEDLKSAQTQQTAMLMRQLGEGKVTLAGRMGEHLERHAAEIRQMIRGLSPATAWRKTVEFVIDNSILIWFSPHGNCLPLSPVKMHCHEQAGTASWLNKRPNYTTREPSLCAGCPCFILDVGRAEYWRDRYLTNTLCWKKAELIGESNGFDAIKDRAKQAGALLRKIGVNVSDLDAEVEMRLNGGLSGKA